MSEQTVVTDESDHTSKLIEDPSLIQDHETALEVLDILDAEIANIQTQIDAYTISASRQKPSHESEQWAKRAMFALNIRRQERDKVFKRDREIRGVYIQGQKKNPQEGLLKQQRLADETAIRKIDAETKRLRAQLQISEMAEKRALSKLFMQVAKDKLDQNIFEAIYTEAYNLRKLTSTIKNKEMTT